MLHPEQGKPVGFGNTHARAHPRHQPGVDQQCRATAVEVPRELLETDRRPTRSRAHRHGVELPAQRLCGDGVKIADYRHSGDCRCSRRSGAGRGAGTADLPAEPGVAPGVGDEGGDVVDSTDGKECRHRMPAAPQVMKPATEAPVADGGQDDGCPHSREER